MNKKIKYAFWKFFKTLGIEILPDEKKNSLQSYLFDLLKKKQIDYVLDVGSNVGQFYNLLRNIGYKGPIELFEPLNECQEKLISITKNNKHVKLNPFALGDQEGTVNFYITKNNVSSSLLLPKDSSKICKSYEVSVKTIDSLDYDLASNSGVLLKIDAQGYEKNIILGSINTLKSIKFVLMELSISAQYVGELEMMPMFDFMKNLGYVPIFIYPGITNKFNEVIQYEVIFKKS